MKARVFGSWRVVASALAMFTALALVASCGSNTAEQPTDVKQSTSSTSEANTTEAASSSESSSAANTETSASEPASDDANDPTGHKAFPELEPTPPAAGKKLFIVTLSMSLAGNVRQVDAAQEAAERIGWDVVIVDADFAPSNVASGIRRAIAEKADGIILQAMDYGSNAAAIDEARAAGIKTVSIVAGNKAPEEVDYDVTYDQHDAGGVVADYIAQKSDKSASVIVMNDTAFTLVQNIVDGVTEGLQECEKCSVAEEVKFTADQVGPDFIGIVQTALARNPDAEWLVTPYGTIAIYARQAIQNSGSEVKIVSTASDLVNYEYISNKEEGIQVASVDTPAEYLGYMAVYQVNRLVSGMEPLETLIPIKALDGDNLPPAGQAWTGDEPYQATFETAWGL